MDKRRLSVFNRLFSGGVSGGAAFLFCCAMLVVFPLYFDDKYFNIVDAKLVYFIVHLAALCVFLLVVKLFAQRPKERLGAAELSVLAWAVFCAVSTVLSKHPAMAFFGVPARYNGLLLIIACCLAWVVASRELSPAGIPALLALFLIGAVPVSLLAAANHFGADPLGMYRGIAEQSAPVFISTIGNINFTAVYICLVLPAAIFGYISARRRAEQTFYAAVLLFLFAGVFACTSDSAYVGVAAAVVAILLRRDFCIREFFRLLQAAVIAGITLLVFSALNLLLPDRVHMPSGVTALLTRPSVALAVTAAAAILTLVLHIALLKKPQLAARSPHKVVLLVVGLLFAVCVAALVFAGIRGRLGDTWGSGRGVIWRVSWSVFSRDNTLLQKLFGTGPDTLVHSYYPEHGWELVDIYWNSTVDAAHNEYLQNLLTTGVFGALAWISVLVSHLKGLFKAGAPAALTAIRLSILAYAAQAVFNIAMPTTFPILLILMGMARCMERPEKAGEPALAPTKPRGLILAGVVAAMEAALIITAHFAIPLLRMRVF